MTINEEVNHGRPGAVFLVSGCTAMTLSTLSTESPDSNLAITVSYMWTKFVLFVVITFHNSSQQNNKPLNTLMQMAAIFCSKVADFVKIEFN